MCSHHTLAVLVSSLVSLSEDSIDPTLTTQQDTQSGFEDTEPVDSSMQEFYQLYQELLVITLVLTGIVFISVCIAYSLNIALNYLLGACAGVVYLRMLAKDVERLGREKQALSKTRLALLVALILLASRWNQLQILPIFLGFLTYKATLIIYVVRMAFISD
ncbi:MAG: ATP synthase subunit I [Trichormus sp. ATA11-4-KO1]|jgi:ATP synthase protein I|nr:ATP synthase subunit I [Trichormus sp. ATA11-4-KO1]